jgi:ELWxxDGT repeat protein
MRLAAPAALVASFALALLPSCVVEREADVHDPGPARPVADIAPDAVSSHPSFPTDVGGTLFFVAFPDGIVGSGDLWRSAGTPATTAKIRSFVDYPHDLREVAGRLFFTAGDESGWGIWTSDGSESGTHVVARIAPPGARAAASASAGGRYFVAVAKGGLWASDGTEAGTRRVVESLDLGGPFALAALGDAVVFVPKQSTQLHRSDGTIEGTSVVTSVSTILSGTRFAVRSPNAYFTGDDGSHRAFVWRTDGTAEGTKLALDEPGATYEVLAVDDGAFVTTMGADHRPALWSLGAGRPAERIPFTGSSLFLSSIGGLAYGLGDGRIGRIDTSGIREIGAFPVFEEIVEVDGGLAGVTLDGAIFSWRDGRGERTLASFSSCGKLKHVGGYLFFNASTRAQGNELWSIPIAALR